MGRVEVPKGRATVSTQMGALEIVIPSKKSVFVMLFLTVWLCGWFVGETAAIHELIAGNAKAGDAGFLALWLTGWTVGGCFASAAWLWNLAGREILTIGRGELVHRRAIGPLGFSQSYNLAHVKELRALPCFAVAFGRRSGRDLFGINGGPIAFDYGAKTIRIGAGIEEAEAKGLVESIKTRYHI